MARRVGVSSNPGTPSLAGQDAEYLVAATRAYKEGSRSDESMKSPAGTLDDKALANAAAFYASQSPQAQASSTLSSRHRAQRVDAAATSI